MMANGTLKRGRCWCGRLGQAHHRDYSKPVEVEWLCHRHHLEVHGKEFRKEHPIKIEDLRDYQREYHKWYSKTEKSKVCKAKWRMANKDKVRVTAKRYYDSHAEEVRKKGLEYYYRNREKVKEYQAKYRAEHRKDCPATTILVPYHTNGDLSNSPMSGGRDAD